MDELKQLSLWGTEGNRDNKREHDRMKDEQQREANAEFKTAQSAIRLRQYPSAPMKKGTKIFAAMDIKFSGDSTCIERGRKGVIESAGRMACNVWFEGYDKNHLVLCLWDMVAPRKIT